MEPKAKVPQIHISITGEFGEMLERLSKHLGISKSAVVRMAVKLYYDQVFPSEAT